MEGNLANQETGTAKGHTLEIKAGILYHLEHKNNSAATTKIHLPATLLSTPTQLLVNANI